MKILSAFFLLASFLLIVSPPVLGQAALSKGSYSIAGTLMYSSNSSSDNFNHTFQDNYLTFSPQFVSFVADHFSIGGFINYSNSSHFINDNHVNTMSNLSFGPLFRYYFYSETVIPFIETSFSYYIPDTETGNSSNLYGINLKAGIDYFLSGSIAVEPSFQYSYELYSSSDATINEFTVNIGINYFIF